MDKKSVFLISSRVYLLIPRQPSTYSKRHEDYRIENNGTRLLDYMIPSFLVLADHPAS